MDDELCVGLFYLVWFHLSSHMFHVVVLCSFTRYDIHDVLAESARAKNTSTRNLRVHYLCTRFHENEE